MERKLFKWENWDELSCGEFMFYDVELVQQIKDYPLGTKFDSAFVDFDTGDLVFYSDANTEVAKFKLRLVVL